VTRWKFARRAASRFVAGERLEEAVAAIQVLNQKGLCVTLDHLGENVTEPEEARRSADDYLTLIGRVREAGVKSNASVKLSQLGLALDYDLCLENVRHIVRRAAECGLFIRIDMEDSSTVDKTLQIYRTLRSEGLRNVGLVIQAYLYRSEKDVQDLLAEGALLRLCKGAYKEPADVAFPRKRDVDANYDKLARMMIDAALAGGSLPASDDGRTPPVSCIATHDDRRVRHAQEHAKKVGLPKRALEFQMLYGIRPELQTSLAAEGYPVRIYVPYGTEWYPYYVRRLAERPANVWFFIYNFFRR